MKNLSCQRNGKLSFCGLCLKKERAIMAGFIFDRLFVNTRIISIAFLKKTKFYQNIFLDVYVYCDEVALLRTCNPRSQTTLMWGKI